MSTVTVSASRDGLLRATLHANSIVSLVGGLVMALASGLLAPLMGVSGPVPLIAVGVVAMAFGYEVRRESNRSVLSARAGWIIFALDALWVAGSLCLLALDAFGLSTEGRWIVLAMADGVALFAVCEFIGLRRIA